MTREEAIKILKAIRVYECYPKSASEETKEAIDMAINALAVYPQYKWERDIALSQLEEYGIGFAEKKRDDLVEVVRCKDCRWYKYDSYCSKTEAREIDADNFCSYGERKEE